METLQDKLIAANREPLPQLPTTAGRIRYAMGRFDYAQFAKRTGLPESTLRNLTNGRSEPSYGQAKKIADCSEFDKVTEKWIFYGIAETVAPVKEPTLPELLPNADVLPHFDTFSERYEWALKRQGWSLRTAARKIGLYGESTQYSWRTGAVPNDSIRKPMAEKLQVPYEWLFDGVETHSERYARTRNNKYTAGKKKQQESTAQEIPKNTTECHKITANNTKQQETTGTHMQLQGVYSGDVLAAIVGVLKGTYKVELKIDEV